jgi:hypothetical protein
MLEVPCVRLHVPCWAALLLGTVPDTIIALVKDWLTGNSKYRALPWKKS